MPYISRERRKYYEGTFLPAMREHAPTNVGELNYLICQLIEAFLIKRAPITYKVLNDIAGVLSSVSMEFYRRVMVPYEDKKKEENGDVFMAHKQPWNFEKSDEPRE